MASFCQCITILISTLLIGSACKTENPYYCEGAPHTNCKFEAGVQIPCLPACSGNMPVCDTNHGTCIQCTSDEPQACVGATPVCRGNTCEGCKTQQECGSSACLQDGSCGKCTEHEECTSSLACLPSGECATPAQVAYVQSGGTGQPPCAKGTPCGTLQQGIDTVNAMIPYIKVSNKGGVLRPNATTMINGKAVIILADPGATLTRTGSGANLAVSNAGADVEIYDLEIFGASDVGISILMGGMPKLALTRVRVTNNMGGGISATGGSVTVSQSTITNNMSDGISATGGSVTVSQSTISGNSGLGASIVGGTLRVSQSTIASNSGGGISTTGSGLTFDITNCFIFRNGNDANADTGGVSLKGSTTGVNAFSFNTVVDNRIRDTGTSAGGVLCDISSFAASNNIIARNFRNNMSGQSNSNTLMSGQCMMDRTSTIVADVSVLKFVSSDSTPYNYHLNPGSSAIDKATTPSTLTVDFDGNVRPQGTARDQGADEVPP